MASPPQSDSDPPSSASPAELHPRLEPQPHTPATMTDPQPSPPVQATAATPAPVSSVTSPSAPPGRRFAPALGTRIEVLWRINSPEDGEGSEPVVQERWWGAVVQDCTREPIGQEACSEYGSEYIHILLYDAFGEFEEDVASVAFLPQRTLVDVARLDDEEGGRLDWRVEGEAEAGAEALRDPSRLMTLSQYLAEQDAIADLAGVSKDADLLALSQYPANVQLHMVEGYRRFADAVRGMLEELVRTKPAGYAVTPADVEAIYERVHALRSNRGGANAGT